MLIDHKENLTAEQREEIAKTYATTPNDYENRERGYRVRKLTTRECFRGMGVKDEDFEKIEKNQSNSALYHLAGDSIVTTCLMAIFGELLDIDWESKVKELQDNITGRGC